MSERALVQESITVPWVCPVKPGAARLQRSAPLRRSTSCGNEASTPRGDVGGIPPSGPATYQRTAPSIMTPTSLGMAQ